MDFLQWSAQWGREGAGTVQMMASRDFRRKSIPESSAKSDPNPILLSMRGEQNVHPTGISSTSKLSISTSLKDNSSSTSLQRKRQLQLYDQVITSSKKYRLLTLLITVFGIQTAALVTLNITLSVTIKTSTEATYGSSDAQNIGSKQIFAEELAFSALLLYFNFSQDFNAAGFDNLSRFIGRMQESNDAIWGEIKAAGTSEYRRFMTETPVVTWELLSGEIVYKERTLLDAVQKLLDESTVLQSSYNTSLSVESAFYVYRNGLGETFAALEAASDIYMKSQHSIISNLIDFNALYYAIAFSVMTAATVTTFYFAIRLHKIACGMSSLLLKSTSMAYHQEIGRLADRLLTRYDKLIPPESERRSRGTSRTGTVYSPLAAISLLTVLMWIVACGFYAFLYLHTLADLEFELRSYPVAILQDSSRLVNLIETDIWVTECHFRRHGLSSQSLVFGYSLVPSPVTAISPALSRIVDSSLQLLKLVSSGYQVTTNHFDFAMSATNFTSHYFKKGYRGGTVALLQETLFCLSATLYECDTLVRRLFDIYGELAANSALISGFYAEDGKLNINRIVSEVSVLMTLFSITLVGVMVAFLACFSGKIYSRQKGLLALCTLLRGPAATGVAYSSLSPTL